MRAVPLPRYIGRRQENPLYAMPCCHVQQNPLPFCLKNMQHKILFCFACHALPMPCPPPNVYQSCYRKVLSLSSLSCQKCQMSALSVSPVCLFHLNNAASTSTVTVLRMALPCPSPPVSQKGMLAAAMPQCRQLGRRSKGAEGKH